MTRVLIAEHGELQRRIIMILRVTLDVGSVVYSITMPILVIMIPNSSVANVTSSDTKRNIVNLNINEYTQTEKLAKSRCVPMLILVLI